MTSLQTPWKRVCAKAGIDGKRIHDLRHTVGSHGASSGLSLPLVGAVLGHQSAKSTERYSKKKRASAVAEAAASLASSIAAATDRDDDENVVVRMQGS